MKKTLSKRKGTAIPEWIIIVIVTSIIAVSIIIPLNKAVELRQLKTIENYNGTDTITEFD